MTCNCHRPDRNCEKCRSGDIPYTPTTTSLVENQKWYAENMPDVIANRSMLVAEVIEKHPDIEQQMRWICRVYDNERELEIAWLKENFRLQKVAMLEDQLAFMKKMRGY